MEHPRSAPEYLALSIPDYMTNGLQPDGVYSPGYMPGGAAPLSNKMQEYPWMREKKVAKARGSNQSATSIGKYLYCIHKL